MNSQWRDQMAIHGNKECLNSFRKPSMENRSKRNLFKIVIIVHLPTQNLEAVVQLVRTTDCGSVGRGFETHPPPKRKDKAD